MCVAAADILKANDEVIRVMALYEDTVYKLDGDSALIDHANEDVGNRGQCTWHLYHITVHFTAPVGAYCTDGGCLSVHLSVTYLTLSRASNLEGHIN